MITGTLRENNAWYRTQIAFLRSILEKQSIEMTKKKSRVAGSFNGISPNIIFDFNDAKTLDAIEKSLQALQNTGRPMNLEQITGLLKSLFTRSTRGKNVAQVLLMMLTQDTDLQQLKGDLQVLKDSGIRVVVVVVGNKFNKALWENSVGGKKDLVFIKDGKFDDVLLDDVDSKLVHPGKIIC